MWYLRSVFLPIDPKDPAIAALAKLYRANGAIRTMAFEGDLNLVMRSMLERVRKRAAESELVESTRRIAVKTSPGSCGKLLPNSLQLV